MTRSANELVWPSKKRLQVVRQSESIRKAGKGREEVGGAEGRPQFCHDLSSASSTTTPFCATNQATGLHLPFFEKAQCHITSWQEEGFVGRVDCWRESWQTTCHCSAGEDVSWMPAIVPLAGNQYSICLQQGWVNHKDNEQVFLQKGCLMDQFFKKLVIEKCFARLENKDHWFSCTDRSHIRADAL